MPLLRDRLLRYRLVLHVNSPKLFNPLIALRISTRISLLAGLSVFCVAMMVAAHFIGDAAVRRAFEKEDRLALQADYTVKIDGALNRAHEGTGPGLPLCKALVEQYGGTLAM